MSAPTTNSKPRPLRGRVATFALLTLAFIAGKHTSQRRTSDTGGSKMCAEPAQAQGSGELTWLTTSDQLKPVLRSALDRLRRGKARLLYYHVPKSGGTSMCNAMVQANARLMGCTDEYKDKVVADPSNQHPCNCNGHLKLRPTPIAAASPEEVLQYIKARRPVAFFNEDSVADEPYFGPWAVHAIVVRHPVARYVSQMMHWEKFHANVTVDEVDVNKAAEFHTQLQPGEAGRFPDNYLTRYTGGWSRRSVEEITFEHFQAALHNLERMQVVLVLEDKAGSAPLLKALGLQPFADETRMGSNFTLMGKGVDSLTHESQRRIEQLHKWDLALYEWCLQRHRRTIEAFAQL